MCVLLVEDDPLIRGLMGMALQGEGYEVLLSTNGEEALELVETRPNRKIDLLIADLVMPRIGGNELASRIKAIYPQMRVLFCSGHPKENIFPENSPDRDIPFLRKPFTTTAFLERVYDLLRV